MRGSAISIYRCACSPHGLGVWQMASPAPVATSATLGPGSMLGPGRLGERYRIRDILNTIDGSFAEVFSVELMLEHPPPNPAPMLSRSSVA
jgi:hypothetical protein